jgi:hypothetical protein
MTLPTWLTDALNLASIIGICAAIGVAVLFRRIRRVESNVAALLAAQSKDLMTRLNLFPLRLAVYEAADQAAQLAVDQKYGADLDSALEAFKKKLFESRFMFDKAAFDGLDDLWVTLGTCNDMHKAIEAIQNPENAAKATRELRTLEAVVLRKSTRLPTLLRLSMQLDEKSTFATSALGASPLTQKD